MSALDAVLERLTHLHPRAIDLSLDRIRHLMGRLGNPQDHLPPVIHVAGTNGKGSTVAILRACFEAAGYRTHAYTSPHLVRFNERIRLGGKLIDDAALIALIEEIERVNDGTAITFFEVTTAVAFLAFARQSADVVLLETGLGGILDATNIIAEPAATIITPIAMDHMNWFGHDIRRIAAEKAGILKPGRPAIIGPQRDDSAAILVARANKLAAPLYRHGIEWQTIGTSTGWRYVGTNWQLDLPLPNLIGAHQIENAGGAVACLEHLTGFSFTWDIIAAGLSQIDWPARMQRLTKGPLIDLLPEGNELWLDGAHNEHGGTMLGRHAAQWTDRPLHVIFGGLTTRDPADVLRDLAPSITRLYGVTIPGEHSAHSAEAVADAGRAIGIDAIPALSVADAIRTIMAHAEGPVRVLICGSLYLAGHVLGDNS